MNSHAGGSGTAERSEWLKNAVMPHEQWVRRRLQGLGVPLAAVDDVIHDSYVRLLNAESVPLIRDSRAYFVQAARSVVFSQSQRKLHVREDEICPDLVVRLSAEEPGPTRVLEGRSDLTHISKALGRLSERARDVVSLRRLQFLTAAQTAQRMKISVSAVEKHLGTAMRRLTSAILSYPLDDGDADVPTVR